MSSFNNSPIDNHTIFIFWTGTNEMSFRRIHCINALKTQTECTVQLIDQSNLDQYILPEYPLHPAYPYLSETHRCDYLRTYFMRFYGGGYSDIKIPNGSWKHAFECMQNDPNVWIIGYPESSPDAIASPKTTHLWQQLVGNCAYIVRPNTPFVKEWFDRQQSLLTEKYEALKANPSTRPDDCIDFYPQSKYPIEWNQLLGRIFHEVLGNYTEHIQQLLPTPNFHFYR